MAGIGVHDHRTQLRNDMGEFMFGACAPRRGRRTGSVPDRRPAPRRLRVDARPSASSPVAPASTRGWPASTSCAVSTSVGSTRSSSLPNTSRAAIDQHDADGAGDQQADDRVGRGKSQRRRRRAPATTASDVKPSVRACNPSARSAADPIASPTRMRYTATTSLPMNPTMPATATQLRCDSGTGSMSRGPLRRRRPARRSR